MTALSAAHASTRTPWWAGETGLALGSVPKHLPPRPDGRPVSVSTVYRATTAGTKGVRLRRFKSGGAWATTLEEIARWQAALTVLSGEEVA